MASRIDLNQIAVTDFKLQPDILLQDFLSIENIAKRVRSLLFLLVCIQVLGFFTESKRHCELLGNPGL